MGRKRPLFWYAFAIGFSSASSSTTCFCCWSTMTRRISRRGAQKIKSCQARFLPKIMGTKKISKNLVYGKFLKALFSGGGEYVYFVLDFWRFWLSISAVLGRKWKKKLHRLLKCQGRRNRTLSIDKSTPFVSVYECGKRTAASLVGTDKLLNFLA